MKYLCPSSLGDTGSSGVGGGGLDGASSCSGRRRGVSLGSFLERSGGLLGICSSGRGTAVGMSGGFCCRVLVRTVGSTFQSIHSGRSQSRSPARVAPPSHFTTHSLAHKMRILKIETAAISYCWLPSVGIHIKHAGHICCQMENQITYPRVKQTNINKTCRAVVRLLIQHHKSPKRRCLERFPDLKIQRFPHQRFRSCG